MLFAMLYGSGWSLLRSSHLHSNNGFSDWWISLLVYVWCLCLCCSLCFLVEIKQLKFIKGLDHTNLQRLQKYTTAKKLGKMAGLSIKINRLLLTEKMNGMFHPEPLCSIKFNTLVLNPKHSKQFSSLSRQFGKINKDLVISIQVERR